MPSRWRRVIEPSLEADGAPTTKNFALVPFSKPNIAACSIPAASLRGFAYFSDALPRARVRCRSSHWRSAEMPIVSLAVGALAVGLVTETALIGGCTHRAGSAHRH
jgi:hypothetical protein